jgi:glutathione S-transferase
MIWDSLAIIEYLSERHRDTACWPRDAAARAIARSASAEMHSSFYALRDEFPMDFVRVLGFPQASEKALADIGRIVEIWKDCRARFGEGGAFLFGDFSAADAMFAPVASRFVTYEVELARFGDDGTAARYRDTVMAMPELRAWHDAAQLED